MNYLKVVCAYFNSSLARYYQFLTGSQWGVERDAVLLTEQKSFPCAIPLEDTDLVHKIVALVDRSQETSANWNWQRELDELVYKSYGVTSSEQHIIEDFLNTTMDRYYRRVTGECFRATLRRRLDSL